MRFTALTLLSVLATAVVASPLFPRQNGTTATASAGNSTSTASSGSNSTSTSSTGQPVVTIYPWSQTGQPVQISGVSANGLDSYYGIPFAKPPVNDLRFTPPQTPEWNTTTFNATKQPPACLQPSSQLYTANYGTNEDCLYLNVQVPKGANAQTAYLPVLVWVYGGSFVTGAASFYNGQIIVGQSALSQKPVIIVALNYRLGILGFPQGAEAAQAGAANLGLKDVQKGLEWVRDNIWAFGGDPSRVTLAGQSAGAILTSLLYLQPDLNLFRSAIMLSGAQSTAAIGPTGSTWQAPYDALVQFTSCGNSSSSANSTTSSNSTSSTNSSSIAPSNYSSSFECLRALPAEQLLAAQVQTQNITAFSGGFVFAPSIDGDIIPDSPHSLLAAGQFAKIPFISGNVLDEGTIFVPAALPLTNETVAALALASIEPKPPSQETLQQLLTQVYPNDPSVGSPYNTGNETFGRAPEYKQLSAIIGDAAFQANRRWFLEQANNFGLNGKTWSYQFQAYTPGSNSTGSFHGSDVPYVFGLTQAIYNNISTGLNGFAKYGRGDAQLSQQIIDYYLNFIYYTDPSGGNSNSTYWPAYGSDLNLLTFNTTGTGNNSTATIGQIKDDYRTEQMQFFLDRPVDFNYKRGTSF